MMQPLSLAKYPYVHGNPVNGVDPTGMFLIAGETLRELWEKTLTSLDTAIRYKSGTEAIWAAKYAGQLVIYSAINITVMTALITAEYYIVEKVKEELQKYRIPVVIYGENDHPEHTKHIFEAITGDGYTMSRRGSPPCSPINSNLSSGRSPFILELIEKKWRDNSAWMNLVLDRLKCSEVTGYTAPPGVKKAKGYRDEYPFISVAEGGVSHYLFDNSVSLKVVSQSESNKQGWLMRNFYNDKEVDLEPYNPLRDRFLVVPIPLPVDSGYITRKGDFKDYKSLTW